MTNKPDYLAVGVGFGTGLTKREIQCLEYACLGYTDKEIAKAIILSPRTVGSFMMKAALRLGAKNRTHAAVLYTYKKFNLGDYGNK